VFCSIQVADKGSALNEATPLLKIVLSLKKAPFLLCISCCKGSTFLFDIVSLNHSFAIQMLQAISQVATLTLQSLYNGLVKALLQTDQA